MVRAFAVCCPFVAGCSDETPQPTPHPPTLKSAVVAAAAKKIADARTGGDYAYVVDNTWPGFVAAKGGRDKAIQELREAAHSMKESGATLSVYILGEPGEFFYEDGKFFVVVRTRLEMLLSADRFSGISYLLGISTDDGRTWKFADGGEIDEHSSDLTKVLPKLPPNLKFPEVQAPSNSPAN